MSKLKTALDLVPEKIEAGDSLKKEIKKALKRKGLMKK
jgi:hypothetical protein